MAALSEIYAPELTELRRVRVDDLDAVLNEEELAWRDRLSWDFRPSADLVRRFVGVQALSGFALVAGGRVIGYSYFVTEDHKGLVGDLYILRDFATVELEYQLLEAVLDRMMSSPFLHRVESQLMMLHSPLEADLPHASFAGCYPRNFMVADLGAVGKFPVGKARQNIVLEPWSERFQEDAARVIASAYQGHIDSEINDQYRSVQGARRFLVNIVQYPGCGSFFQPASFVAQQQGSGQTAGICLSSLVSPEVGHITQVCVMPGSKGSGAGYELVRSSLLALAEHGCHSASLTVTSANREAVKLYERMGFVTKRNFSAFVWEGF
ncbi:MAG: GNAT family N-acetyltransferase [Bryobacteraceae bacterium]|nr:GNAT family N-acetyltransferase [Bryobacterales bacterium]MEB2361438.1 GNAT family N-acetyltransferase [Bryobacterales bacterium]NUN03732.1 GNAT family N-acetyltransferase [Bryobacteraceae bacterium]